MPSVTVTEGLCYNQARRQEIHMPNPRQYHQDLCRSHNEREGKSLPQRCAGVCPSLLSSSHWAGGPGGSRTSSCSNTKASAGLGMWRCSWKIRATAPVPFSSADLASNI